MRNLDLTMTDSQNASADLPVTPENDHTPQDVPLPPPTLISLASGLAHQVMISLGVFPNPIDGSTTLLLHQGQHLIDTIALLDEKTRGSQTEEEKQTLTTMLHELRMIYLAAQKEKSKRDSR